MLKLRFMLYMNIYSLKSGSNNDWFWSLYERWLTHGTTFLASNNLNSPIYAWGMKKFSGRVSIGGIGTICALAISILEEP